jgi:GNAT superfamily N-acetyltransferase
LDFLLPEHEGRGVGKALLGRVTAWLIEHGCSTPWLMTTANPRLRAQGFYLAQGWRATGQVNEDGEERFEYETLAKDST